MILKRFNATGIPQALLSEFALSATGFNGFSNARSHEDRTQQQTCHVIVSTGSGTGTALQVWAELVKPLLSYLGLHEGGGYTVHITESANSVSEIAQQTILPAANDGRNQSILLLSGDGGIVDIINALLSAEHSTKFKKPLISLLPLGTGNALANSSGLNQGETLGLRAMLQGHPKPLPLFRATFSPGAKLLVDEARREEELQGNFRGMPTAHGAVVCSWGHHAALVADSDTVDYRKFGSERFKMAAQEALFPSDGLRPHAYKGRVRVRRPGAKENAWEDFGEGREHGYVLATFVSQLEKGFMISPSSRPLDRKLRLVYFGDLNGQEAMEVMTKAFQGGKHVEDERLRYEEIGGLRIEFDEEDPRWRRVCIDGKIVRVEERGWVEISTDVEEVVDLVCLDL